MIRYLEVIAGEMRRTRIAMTARGYDPSWIAQIRPLATAAGLSSSAPTSGGRGFIKRCWRAASSGDFPTAFDDHSEVVRWWPAMAPVLLAWVTMIIGKHRHMKAQIS